MGVNKFTAAEILLGSCLTLLVEFANWLLDLIGVGFVIMPVLKAMVWIMFTMWFIAKGDKFITKPARAITSYVSQALPIVPTLLLAFLINVYMHNHPKIAKMAGGLGKGTVSGAVTKTAIK